MRPPHLLAGGLRKEGEWMKKMNARETLLYLAELLTAYLEELRSAAKDGFAYGEKTAYTECLEIVQLWDEAAVNGLDYKIEKRYPL